MPWPLLREYHNTFSSAHRPVLRIKPGDRVLTKTIDAWGFDSLGKKAGERPNPETGPFFIEGAERGDILVVRLEKIEPNRATAWSGSLLAPYAVDPAFLRSQGLKEPQDQTWTIDKKNGIAYLESATFRPGRIEVPLKPMLGCAHRFADIVPVEADGDLLSAYRLLVFPGWHTMEPEDADRLAGWAGDGGTLVMSLAQLQDSADRTRVLRDPAGWHFTDPKRIERLTGLRILGRGGRIDSVHALGRSWRLEDPRDGPVVLADVETAGAATVLESGCRPLLVARGAKN